MTLAGVALAGTPATEPPEAQVMASTMSEVAPPHLPSTRTGWIFAPYAMPATPLALFVAAAMVPATWVPCQEELLALEPRPHSPSVAFQSPWSAGLLSRPLPSRASAELEMKS